MDTEIHDDHTEGKESDIDDSDDDEEPGSLAGGPLGLHQRLPHQDPRVHNPPLQPLTGVNIVQQVQ